MKPLIREAIAYSDEILSRPGFGYCNQRQLARWRLIVVESYVLRELVDTTDSSQNFVLRSWLALRHRCRVLLTRRTIRRELREHERNERQRSPDG